MTNLSDKVSNGSGQKNQKISTVLGFDFGMKRIGVAVGQSITETATPLPLLPAQDGAPNWVDVKAVLEEWKPQLLLVGLPVHMDGTEQLLTKAAKRFGNRLNGRFNLPVEWVDERLTSYEAEQMVDTFDIKLDGRHLNIDSLSAKLIVEQWFNTK